MIFFCYGHETVPVCVLGRPDVLIMMDRDLEVSAAGEQSLKVSFARLGLFDEPLGK